MGFFELFLIGIGLSMDAFAVAICKGLGMERINKRDTLLLALFFGGFQALMPLTGYLLGSRFASYIERWDHWIAFVLLAFIGGNMIKESFSKEESCTDASFGFRTMLLMALATSIDALAVGLSFSLLNINVWGPSTLIGVVCAVITALGLLAGKGLAHADIFGRRAELVGGCVLIGIGLKILYEHGVLS